MADQSPDTTVIWEPQPRQSLFITCPVDDVGFGGARGGGKSDAVIGDWISHEHLYAESAVGLAFRRERTQLTELIERARQILPPLGYKWHEQDKYFRGPKGGRLRFSYLESDSDADAYQGHSYTRLYGEEIGTFPSEGPIAKLTATLRSGNGVPCQMKNTCNPGGPGHQWVKARYKLDTHPRGMEVFKYEFTNPFTKKRIEKTRVFIPSKVTDNKFLGDDYVANLFQVGSEQLVRAWLEGDWSVIDGAFFDAWSPDRHILPPFEVPKDWTRFRAFDWGYAKPFSVGWWAIASESIQLGIGKNTGLGQANGLNPQPMVVPRGALVRYREWYGAERPNVGLRLNAEDVADGIKSREVGDKIAYSVADPAIFSMDGGPSIAERMNKRGIVWSPADNKRVAKLGAMGGWDQMRARLKGDDDGHPMIFTFATCRDSIRTIPALQHDGTKPEDLDTDGEDHCFTGDTLVETPDGPVALDALVGRDGLVFTSAGVRRFRNARLIKTDAVCVEVTFSDGRKVKCTPDHRFLTSAGWVEAVDLTDKWCYSYEPCKLKSYQRPLRHLMASAITNAGLTTSAKASGFIAWFGSISTGLSRMASMSTMKTTTGAITSPTIFGFYRPKNTWGIIQRKAGMASALWKSPAQRLLNGTRATRAENGTSKTTKPTFGPSLLSAPKKIASFAERPIRSTSTWLKAVFIATPTVGKRRCVSVAPSASADVYCLTVPDTGDFCIEGGLIVSNCGDEWRYACMSRPYVKTKTEAPKPMAFVGQPDGTIKSTLTFNEMVKRQGARRANGR